MTLPPAGLPRDPAQWLALALAIAAVVAARPLLAASPRPRAFAALAALAAASLSAAYVAVYLRGGPRIIDASSYFLEGRALAEGFFSFPLRPPESSVMGRFLVRSEHPGGPEAAVIFPPGYPAVLALGFLARAPLAIGPLIAGAIALATFDLARQVARDLGLSATPSVAQLAALLSVVCAALRYHTADTMSHGLAALCFTAALTLLFRAADAADARRRALLAGAAGLAAGWLFATRPVSAVALSVVVAYLGARGGAARASRLAGAVAVGAIPGVALFLAHQYAATGSFAASSQRLYYAASDGPPGCFRYGFGAGVGCVGEHGDFVRAHLASGYGVVAALGTTLRRLKLHLVDPLNLEPLALLVPAGAFFARKSPRGRALALAVAAQIVAYAPFYFDGNYPGGGGRMFCDVLPLEHVLASVAVVVMASRRAAPERWAAGAVAVALAGFAFRAGFDHAALRDRDGGRPLFEPAVLARAGIARGLLFVDTDHGFDLAFDPASRAGLDVVRFHGDALDRFAWEARGRPPAYRYRFEIPPESVLASVGVEPLVFPAAPASPVWDAQGPLVIEGESLWPALEQRNAFALPEWADGPCASAGRRLEVRTADATMPGIVTLALPARWLAGRGISARVAVAEGASGAVGIAGREVLFRGQRGAGVACLDLPALAVTAAEEPARLTLRVDAGSAGLVALDALQVTSVPAPVGEKH